MNNNIIDSKNWINYNQRYLNKNRYEGQLNHTVFNKRIIKYLNKYSKIKDINHSYLVGLELEFYIKIDLLDDFIFDLMSGIPKEMMLIKDTDRVVKSDKQHFFLIKDNT